MAMSKMARHARELSGCENLCLAGGVALNCVSNGKLLREGVFEDIWIQPAAGDAGGALGVAYAVWHRYRKQPRAVSRGDRQRGSYLGPRPDVEDARRYFDAKQAPYTEHDPQALPGVVADLLAEGKVVGLCQGRMEFGPRALGGRSIIGDARSTKMQSVMNLKIKYRESFRPFAPAVNAEKVSEWFAIDRPSPYMLLVAPVRQQRRIEMTEAQKALFGIEKLNVPRSEVPAVTHVDYSARIQTVHRDTNPRFHALIDAFEARTGCPVLVNTSFNVRGEPIVCSPADAYRCFMRTEMDYLVLENVLLAKNGQPEWKEAGDWRKEFTLD
jgi:carbamoyltransferase